MPMNSAQELFEHELEDIYYAEHELLDVLDQLGMDEASDLLHENLEEEEAALEKLKDLTDQYDFETAAA